MKIHINKKILSDFINLKNNVFYPLSEFCDEKEAISIIRKMKTPSKKFFPIPILLPFSLGQKKKVENLKFVNIYYKNYFVAKILIKKFFKIKTEDIKKLYGTSYKKNPSVNYLFNVNNFFIACKIRKFNSKIINKINFSRPSDIKRKINKKSCVGFHTRNAPHVAHEWIHRYGLKKCEKILIQPIIGQYVKGEYREKVLIKTNFISSNMLGKKAIFGLFFSYPRYGGPREAMLHAIVRKNYGCSHFLVGRDHAGYKNLYKKYISQETCYKFQKKLGIKIVKFKEPFLCKKCKKITNTKCNICKTFSKFLISGTNIKNLIKQDKKIPKNLMSLKISKYLNIKSLID